MASGVEIYSDNEILQLGKEYHASFLSESRPAEQVNSNNIVGQWPGVFRILQTSDARIERTKVHDHDQAFPELSNYSADTKWFRLLWRDMTGDLTPTNSGIEIYDSDGNIEYNSNYNPLKIIDIVEGVFADSVRLSGLYTVFKRQYDKPIMVLIDRYYYVNRKLRIIADTNGKFELYLDYDNTFSFGSSSFKYKFIVLDATGAI